MSLTSDLLAETRRYAFAGTREEHNRLTNAADDSETSFAFDFDLEGIAAGAVLAVGLELVYVWSVSGASANVERGWDGSTPAAHDAAAIVTVNPKFSDFDIFKAINSELNALSSPRNGLFQVETVDFTYNAAVNGYDLTGATGVIDIHEIRYQATGPSKDWPEIVVYELDRDADTDVFPSGFAVYLKESAHPGRQVRVTYKAPYSQLATISDNVQTVAGLSQFADDIPPLGAAMRLQSVREGARNFFEEQPETRRADEVPPGSQLKGIPGLEAQFRKRVREEAGRLTNEYRPKRRRR